MVVGSDPGRLPRVAVCAQYATPLPPRLARNRTSGRPLKELFEGVEISFAGVRRAHGIAHQLNHAVCRYSLTSRLRSLVLKGLCCSLIGRPCSLTSEFGRKPVDCAKNNLSCNAPEPRYSIDSAVFILFPKASDMTKSWLLCGAIPGREIRGPHPGGVPCVITKSSSSLRCGCSDGACVCCWALGCPARRAEPEWPAA
jgi:hypothetical protein